MSGIWMNFVQPLQSEMIMWDFVLFDAQTNGCVAPVTGMWCNFDVQTFKLLFYAFDKNAFAASLFFSLQITAKTLSFLIHKSH